VIDRVKKSLKKDNWITIVCFVTCSVTKRKAREGHNPRTGETIKILARKTDREGEHRSCV